MLQLSSLELSRAGVQSNARAPFIVAIATYLSTASCCLSNLAKTYCSLFAQDVYTVKCSEVDWQLSAVIPNVCFSTL